MSIANDRIRLLFLAVLVALATQMFLAAFDQDFFRGVA
jgi:hypothetical protein